MEKYRINFRAICPKRRSTSDYQLLKALYHKSKNSEIGQIIDAPKGPKRPYKTLALAPNYVEQPSIYREPQRYNGITLAANRAGQNLPDTIIDPNRHEVKWVLVLIFNQFN